jgi:hypothetical protein
MGCCEHGNEPLGCMKDGDISWRAERPLVSQEGLCGKELVIKWEWVCVCVGGGGGARLGIVHCVTGRGRQSFHYRGSHWLYISLSGAAEQNNNVVDSKRNYSFNLNSIVTFRQFWFQVTVNFTKRQLLIPQHFLYSVKFHIVWTTEQCAIAQ